MSRIRSKNTKIEKVMAKELRKTRFKFRKHYKIIGSPDFAFPKKKVAVFVDGSFWHGYKWLVDGRRPKQGYWREKIARNIERDSLVNASLRTQGWAVLRFWEHDVVRSPKACAFKVAKKLRVR